LWCLFFLCAVADLNCRPKFNPQRMLAAKQRTSGSSNLPNPTNCAVKGVGAELPTQIQSATDVGCEAANIRQFKSA